MSGFEALRTSRLLGHRRAGLGAEQWSTAWYREQLEETGRVENAGGGESLSAGHCVSPTVRILPDQRAQRSGVRSQIDSGWRHGFGTK